MVRNGGSTPNVFEAIGGKIYFREGAGGDSATGVSSWFAWGTLVTDGIGQVTSLAAAIDKDSNTELFALTNTGAIWIRSTLHGLSGGIEADSNWGPWQSLDGNLSSIAVTKLFDGRLELWGTNSAGQIFERGQFPNSLSWSPWQSNIDGSLAQITAATDIDGKVELFGVNSDDVVFHRVQADPDTNAFSGPWEVITGAQPPRLHTIAATEDNTGALEVFGTNSNNDVFHRYQTTPGGSWTEFTPFPGAKLVSAAAGRMADPGQNGSSFAFDYIFGVSPNGNVYYDFAPSRIPNFVFKSLDTPVAIDGPPTSAPPVTSAPPPPHTATLTLQQQQVGQGPIPYSGAFPALGSVPPFHLISIRYPTSGFADSAIRFVKPGHSTQECDSPAAVVQLNEGSTTTADQITAIYGTAQPHFNTLHPLTAVACFVGPSPTPGFINLDITIVND